VGVLQHDISNFAVQYERNESFRMGQFILLFSVHVQWLCSRWKDDVVIGSGQLNSHLHRFLFDHLEQESSTAHPTRAGLSEPSLNTGAGG